MCAYHMLAASNNWLTFYFVNLSNDCSLEVGAAFGGFTAQFAIKYPQFENTYEHVTGFLENMNSGLFMSFSS